MNPEISWKFKLVVWLIWLLSWAGLIILMEKLR